jgi:hypothetical protein
VQVAVVAVRVVERPGDLVVHVVAVGDRGVSAGGSMPIPAFDGRAGAGTAAVHVQAMLVRVPLMKSMEVAVVKVIDVVAMRNGPVTTIRSMCVAVAFVFGAGHDSSAARIVAPEGAAVKLITCG